MTERKRVRYQGKNIVSQALQNIEEATSIFTLQVPERRSYHGGKKRITQEGPSTRVIHSLFRNIKNVS